MVKESSYYAGPERGKSLQIDLFIIDKDSRHLPNVGEDVKCLVPLLVEHHFTVNMKFFTHDCDLQSIFTCGKMPVVLVAGDSVLNDSPEDNPGSVHFLLRRSWDQYYHADVIRQNNRLFVFLPEHLSEFKQSIENDLIPWIRSECKVKEVFMHADFYFPHASESEAQRIDSGISSKFPEVSFNLCKTDRAYIIHAESCGKTRDENTDRFKKIYTAMSSMNPNVSYFIPEDVRKELFELLKGHRFTLSAAESCTGGLIGKLLTDIPGSSDYFKGSAVTYWNSAKHHILGVSNKILKKCTAVSEPVARKMAKSSRKLYHSDIAVSTTGYAGPGPGERGEDPGLVYIGISGPLGTFVHKEQWYGSREYVRTAAAQKAIEYIYKYAEQLAKNKQ